MLIRKVKTAKMGKENARCCQDSSFSHQRTNRGGRGEFFMRLATLSLASIAAVVISGACDPVTGTGTGTPPDPKQFIHVDAASQTAVVTLIAGHTAGPYQWNYNGYGQGALTLTVPVGWQVTVQCENRGTVNNSCAVVSDAHATSPVDPSWTTPSPQTGLDPGSSATFVFSPTRTGSYRIASLVDGNEASGMWADLEVVSGGVPTLTAAPQ